MFLRVVVIIGALGGFAIWSSWRTRRRLMLRIRSNWGRFIKRERDLEAISDFFRSRDDIGAALDDRTWSDLLLDDVFRFLDRTESTVGQQLLYDRLRSGPRRLDEFEALVRSASSDSNRRERAQAALAGLSDRSGYYLHTLTRPGAVGREWWHFAYPLWGAAVLSALLLAVFWPALLLIAILAFVINFPIRFAAADRINREVIWFRQVGPLLSAANGLTDFDTSETAAITGRLKSDLRALSRLGRSARWVSRDPATTNEIVFSVMEYLNILFLLDVNALYFAAGELKSKAGHLRRLIETVGEIDAAIAIASFRSGNHKWTRPRFLDGHGSAMFTSLCHPLLDNAVPNSLSLGPPHGVLVTGSNMSGKSTFLRTVGVSVVLAQSINTCLAEAYEAPVYQVRSCIGRGDDLLAGKSYYLVEVESVLALVRASSNIEPHLFIFDEIFRGTNTIERIAAAEAVLDTLIDNGKPHVVLAATHDGELVDLLSENYAVCHFEDRLGPEGLTFTYNLTPGPAASRNAIALLKLNGAPESVVRKALARAAELEEHRRKADAIS
jgi:hypothetical protein